MGLPHLLRLRVRDIQSLTISQVRNGRLPMRTIASKDVLFVYNGNEEDADVEFDADGNFPCPVDGSIVRRRGKQWKIAGTRMQSGTLGAKALQVLRID